jgi:outer membrane protein assembly factor BamB
VAGAAQFGEAVAYNAATGTAVWKYHFNSDSKVPGSAFKAIAVSPNGSTVFVTGSTQTVRNGSPCQVIVALNAATGAKLWQVVSSASSGTDSPAVVSPDSSTVYVTSVTLNPTGPPCIWPVPRARQAASAVIVSADFDNAKYSRPHWQTVALNPATGATLWSRGQYGPGGQAFGSAVALSPNGATVYVTGWVSPTSPGYNMLTNGYDIATGATTWNVRFHAKANSFAYALAVSPDGSQVFVTGTDGGMPTIAYAAS